MDEWIETNIGPYEDNFTVRCPSCRGQIARFVEQVTEKIAIPNDRTMPGLLHSLVNGNPIRFVRRSDIFRLDYLLLEGEAADFKANHLTPVNGSYRSYRIPSGDRSGWSIFGNSERVEAGVLALPICSHEIVFLLLTGEQVYHMLSELYVHGWDPYTGLRQRRIDVEAMRGQSLPTIMRHAASRGVRDINHFELEYLFPTYRGWRQREMMHIRLLYSEDRRGRSRAEVLVYDVVGEGQMMVASQEVMVNIVFELGGLGEDFMFTQLTNRGEVLSMSMQFMNIAEPFLDQTRRRNSR